LAKTGIAKRKGHNKENSQRDKCHRADENGCLPRTSRQIECSARSIRHFRMGVGSWGTMHRAARQGTGAQKGRSSHRNDLGPANAKTDAPITGRWTTRSARRWPSRQSIDNNCSLGTTSDSIADSSRLARPRASTPRTLHRVKNKADWCSISMGRNSSEARAQAARGVGTVRVWRGMERRSTDQRHSWHKEGQREPDGFDQPSMPEGPAAY